jgi:CheY-like chemotaxis protein
MNWDRSQVLIAWSHALIAQSRRIRRPVFRGGSDEDGGMIRVIDLSDIRVIVVDDNADNVDILATFLRACGATVLTAVSGVVALAYLDTEPPVHLVLTDLAMPGLNGIELLRRLRAHPKHARLPVIAVSGYPENYFSSDSERFSAFILKPVDLDALSAIVKRLIATMRAV